MGVLVHLRSAERQSTAMCPTQYPSLHLDDKPIAASVVPHLDHLAHLQLKLPGIGGMWASASLADRPSEELGLVWLLLAALKARVLNGGTTYQSLGRVFSAAVDANDEWDVFCFVLLLEESERISNGRMRIQRGELDCVRQCSCCERLFHSPPAQRGHRNLVSKSFLATAWSRPRV